MHYDNTHTEEDLTDLELTYVYLYPPVSIRAAGDEESSSASVTGDPAYSMPGDIHLIQVFIECTSPFLLRPPVLLLPSFGARYMAVWCGSTQWK